MSKQISVLGTGWLGLPLAKALLKEEYIVKGASTTESKLDNLKTEGIDPYLLEIKEDGPKGDIRSFLEKSQILIINIPPGLRRNPESNFVAKINSLIPSIENSTIEKVIFISSTSIFADEEQFPLITSETTPNASTNAGKQLIEAEQLLQENQKLNTIILRFAGLFDSRRHPATMLSKRKNIKNPLAPVNLVHREDCIGIIKKIIKANKWNKTFNASYPDHPSKSEYYSMICKQMELPTPDYNFETTSKGKIIDSKKLQNDLKYSFKRNLYLFS
ncbi:Nucleoside-diphosphate-sugar epimerase [Aquimarina amphilecti]|uniref:Nucleoside-diphosphate-sugar epimerase n=1 Tax=Aquimarina amphilecti TaxID=1038014 RepID=A0A1H7VD44_AQUAM|nr:NAD(P)H-binding protein [Aquimarina amphilecti]SEM07182.1 Nucleoside-diphosphate-sugar epimerase [Aquimarina amphilecti]